MWDPDQRAQIPVIIDRLLAHGDPLGEWLALRRRLDAGGLDRAERRALRRRVRSLREHLGPSLTLTHDSELGRPHVIRELGLIADVSFPVVTRARLAELLARADAPFVLRLRLRGPLDTLAGCVELLREHGGGASSPTRTRAHLRELALECVDARGEPDPGGGVALCEELERRRGDLAREWASLFALSVDGAGLCLPFDRAALERVGVGWSPARRVALGRALSSADSEQRRRALQRLGEHGRDAGQLRAPLMAIIEHEADPDVRAAALAIVPGLGELGQSILVLIGELARERDDPQLRAWLANARRY